MHTTHLKGLTIAGLLTLGNFARAQQTADTLPLPVPNADFEKGAESWTIQDPTAQSKVAPEAAHSGTMGLRISASGDRHGSNAYGSAVPASEGQGFRLTFWAKTQTGNIGAYLNFNDAKGRGLPEYSPATVLRKSNDWTKYQLIARAPYGAAAIKIWIHSFGGATTVADFDDFRLEPASGPVIEGLSVPVPANAPIEERTRKTPAYVVLKLDDLGQSKDRINPRWQKIADFVKERNIHASFGIILNSLEGETPNYLQWIKDQRATGRIEFWNHGYDHRQWDENGQTLQEFNNTSYEQQKDHLVRSEALAREKLGFPIATFGAPYNATDDNTAKAMADIPDFKVWLYGDPLMPGGKVVLHRTENMGIESPLFSPNVEAFKTAFVRYPKDDYFVIQGHPAQWDDARFDQFVKIVDFLTEQKAIFVTPSEYVALKATTPTAAAATPKIQTASFQMAPVAPQSQSLVANGDFNAGLNTGWTFTGKATPQIVDAKIEGAPFTRALQVELAATKDSQPWDARLSAAPTQSPIAKSDLLLVQFWARSTPKSRIRAIFQQSTQPYGKSIRQTASLTPQWQKYTFYAPAASAYSAGGSNFELQLGQANGKVEVTGLSVQNRGALSLSEATKLFGPETFDYYGGETHDDSWIPAAEARIDKIRKADLQISVVDGKGKPVPGAKVTLKETRSAFRWGTAVNERVLEQSPDGEKYRAELKRLFNTAVPDNPLKWKASDGNPGGQARAKAIVDWLCANGFAVRGHNIVWGSNKFLPGRLQGLSPDALKAEIAKRVPEAMTPYKGQLYVWDVVNEAATETELWEKIGWQSFSDVYKAAHATDPQVKLAYNDYNISNEAPDNGVQRHKVEDRIQKLRDAGAPLDILGDQAHMMVPLTPLPRVLQIWDEWGRKYKLPIEITEFDANIADDAVHEKYVHDFLIAAYSDPNIESFLMWGFWEKAHWLGLSGSLFHADWTARPAALAYENLVLEKWRTNATLTASKTGLTQTRAFLGDYDVQVTANGKTTTTQLSLSKVGAQKKIVLQ